MITMSSTEARLHFGEFLDRGSREAIVVKRQNREVGAFVPIEDYRKLQALRMDELHRAAEELSEEARSNGFTEQLLNDILDQVNPS